MLRSALNVAAPSLELSCQDPDDPANWPRNMFVWRSNLLGSSGKGHEYFLKHLLGTNNGVLGKDLGVEGREKPQEVAWHDKAPEGKLDLLVTLDFRMSTTCVYSDIVLPTATWYEKNDLNTSDMHPFIHPLTAAVDPAWEARTDWDIYKGIAKAFSEHRAGGAGPRDRRCADADAARHGRRAGAAVTTCRTGSAAASIRFLAAPCQRSPWWSATTRTSMPASPRSDRCWRRLGNGGKGIGWNTAARNRVPARAERQVAAGPQPGSRSWTPTSTPSRPS